MNEKLNVLNSIDIIDWSASCGELEYVVAENTEENIKTLLEGGFTQEEIDEALDVSEDIIDISLLAFDYANADWFCKSDGFTMNDDSLGLYCN